ncbi:MAG TPA: hypothetical protein VLA32_01435 [Anaerolineales bacterium]|nr:hypothetical protein [Anaerolineales bacterium]
MDTAKHSSPPNHSTPFRQVLNTLRWTRSSYYLLSGFFMLLFLIGYVWWPLVEEYLSYFNSEIPLWRQIDWLLIGNFLFMSVMIMANANLRNDLPILVVGMVGGLAIEGWGTQTELWTYYTFERPPLWIIPAWPIASLSIDRLFRMLMIGSQRIPDWLFRRLYWTVFPAFYVLMLVFVWPTRTQSLTILALTMVGLLIYALRNQREAVLTFAAGAGLGYFLELWGTTRLCWTYYTLQTPPLFAVLAHGMAAVAFWWGVQITRHISNRFFGKFLPLSFRR